MGLEEDLVWEYWVGMLISIVTVSCIVTKTDLLDNVGDRGEFFADEFNITLYWLDEVLEWIREPVPVWIFSPIFIFDPEGFGPDSNKIGRVLSRSEELKTYARSQCSFMIFGWLPSSGHSNKTMVGSREDTGEWMLSAADELNTTYNADWMNWFGSVVKEWESLFFKDVTHGIKGWLH